MFLLIPRLTRDAFGGPKRAPHDPPPRKGPGTPRNEPFLIKDACIFFSTKFWTFCDPPDPRWSGGFGFESVVCCMVFFERCLCTVCSCVIVVSVSRLGQRIACFHGGCGRVLGSTRVCVPRCARLRLVGGFCRAAGACGRIGWSPGACELVMQESFLWHCACSAL